jgi:phage-related protein (TIGR01555 family)
MNSAKKVAKAEKKQKRTSETNKHAPAAVVELKPVRSARALDRAVDMSRGLHKHKRIVSPFIVKPQNQHPPAAMPKSGTIAMDDAIGEASVWAGQFAFNSAYAEGMEFLGYPELAYLAQRPEYRRISETISTEMTRKWIKLQAKGDEDKSDKITKIEAEMERLKIREAFQEAALQDGFFGRSHIYLDVGAEDVDTTDDRVELQTPIGNGSNDISKDKVGTGYLKRLQCVEAVWTYPTQYNSNDPLKPTWYKPDMWFVMGKQIHVSRLLTFIGREVPDLLKPAYSFGGLSLSQMAKPYIDNWLKTRQNVADIVQAFSVFVLSTDLSETLTLGGDQLFKRAELFNNVRNNAGLMMVNKDTEAFSNVSAPLATLDALQAQTQEHIAAVCGIPIVKLLGIQPAGLNASSEGELTCWYEWIAAYQKHLFNENLVKLIGFVQLSLFGEVDPEIGYEFVSLESLSEKELAEKDKLEAETDSIRVNDGILSPLESRQRLAASSTSPYHGLDVEDLPEPPAEQVTRGAETGLHSEPTERAEGQEGKPGEATGGRGGDTARVAGDSMFPGAGDDWRAKADAIFARRVFHALDKEFSEADHPRGQPGNAGQFGSGGGGSKTAKKPATAGAGSSSGSESYSAGLKAHGLAWATSKKVEWRKSAPDSLDAIEKASPANQAALAEACMIAAATVGAEFKNPGMKKRARIEAKLSRGKTPTEVNDAVRGGFDVDTPEAGDKLIELLSKKFEVADEGWQKTPEGYFDRKTMIRFPDGQIGEIQMWPPGMLDVKNKAGHKLYEQWQAAPRQSKEAESLQQQMKDLYGEVEKKLPPEWGSLFREGGHGG